MVDKVALHNLDALMRTNMVSARLILTLIRFLEPGSGGVVVLSRSTMAEILNVSVPTVARALSTLIKGNWVHRLKIGGAYALAINKNVAWVGKRGALDYAVFGATVVASRKEQDAAGLKSEPPKTLPMAHPGEGILAVGQEPEPPHQPGLEGIEPAVARTGDGNPDQLDLLTGGAHVD